MEIKTAEGLLDEALITIADNYDMSQDEYNLVIKTMKEYAAQFIDLAAENALIKGFQMINGKRVDISPDDGFVSQGVKDPYPDLEILIDKQSILNLKKQIK